MPEIDIPVVRIVVKGCPSTRVERTNVQRARNMLLRALEDNRWPGNAMFAITPGGFVKGAVSRSLGWRTRMVVRRGRLQGTCAICPEGRG